MGVLRVLSEVCAFSAHIFHKLRIIHISHVLFKLRVGKVKKSLENKADICLFFLPPLLCMILEFSE